MNGNAGADCAAGFAAPKLNPLLAGAWNAVLFWFAGCVALKIGVGATCPNIEALLVSGLGCDGPNEKAGVAAGCAPKPPNPDEGC